MRSVKPALVGSFIFLLLTSGCPRERQAPPGSVDECRYTLVQPERQQLRVWDGAFTGEDGRECFGRSVCFTGHDRTRVYLSAEVTLAIEVGDARYERALPARFSRRQTHHAGLAHAIAGDEAVALLHAREVELLTATGSERFPLPPLGPGEAFGPPVLAFGGVGLVVGERQKGTGLPVRPFVWLRAPTAPNVDGAERPLLHKGVPVGRLSEGGDGWRVHLASGFTTLAAPPHPTPPSVGVGEGELFIIHDRHVRVLGTGGGALELSLDEKDALVGVADRLYLLAPTSGIERLTPSGRLPILARPSGSDLAGRPLPKGAYVERVQAAGDDDKRLAVIERVRSPGCRIEDRVHLLDVDARKVTTLAEGEGMRLHPRFAAGRLHFIEAEVRYDVVTEM